MLYNILIKENDASLKNYEVNDANVLIERRRPETIFSYPKDETCISKKISDLTIIEVGRDVPVNDMRSDGKYPQIIYLENVLSGNSGLMCAYGLKAEAGNIILGLKSPFDIRILNERAVIAEDIISIEAIDISIKCEYLFLFLKLMCHRFYANGIDEIKVEELKQMDVIIVPTHIQREIIKKGMPIKDNAEHLESVFSSYSETYPLLRSVAK